MKDSGRLLVNACEDDVPDEFWSGVYNVGGRPSWRLTNWDLQVCVRGVLGVADLRRWYERNWFATQNFHGHGHGSTLGPLDPTRGLTYLDLGFDETRDHPTWQAPDLALAADLRGGTLMPDLGKDTGTATHLRWRCAEDHTFTGNPRLVLEAGHWCPTCVTRPYDFWRQAESNAFLRQVI